MTTVAGGAASGGRPVIGVTTAVEPAAWGAWHKPAVLLPVDYVVVLQAVGARAVLLPPDPLDPERPRPAEAAVDDAVEVLRRLDGLVIAGGADVDPSRYGEAPHPQVVLTRPERDASEIALLRAARRLDLPVLGVCRGMQVMAVEAGGRLLQHLPDVVGSQRHAPAPATYGRHGARYSGGSLAARVAGGEGATGDVVAEVNSYHHQGVADPGWLAVTGRADDGTVEALEEPGRRFALGLQSHPEVDRDLRAFAALAEAATRAEVTAAR